MQAALIFPGQGAQYVGMGKDLYDKYPEAREVYDTANDILDFDLKGLCFEGPKDKLSTTSFSQVAILVTSIAALKALKAQRKDLDIKAALGLSLGEYSALVSAGAIDFNDAVKLVRARGQFMEDASQKNPGKMASVIGLDIEKTEELCKEAGCDIANLNCPGQIVISGTNTAIDKAAGLAKEKGAKRAIVLDVSGPFHSTLMAPAQENLKTALSNTAIKDPLYPVISNVDAAHENDADTIRKNLLSQLTRRTYWEDSIRLLIKEGVKNFLEVGPGKVLKGLLRRIDSNLIVHSVGTVEDIANLGG